MYFISLVVISLLVLVTFKNYIDIGHLRIRIRMLEKQNIKPVAEESNSHNIATQLPESLRTNDTVATLQTSKNQNQNYNQTNTNSEPEIIEEGLLEKLIVWYREDWLLKTGAILLILAFGLFTSFAFANNWIIPEYRILLGLLFGFASILVGYLRFKQYVNQAIVFLILGITVVSGTVYAANAVFNFISPITGLSVIFLASALVSIVSLKNNNRLLAVMNLLVSSFAPLLVGTLETNAIITVFYLLAIFLGVSWLSIRNDWSEIPFIILTAAFFYSPIYLFSSNSFATLLFVVALFILVFSISFIKFLSVRPYSENWKDYVVLILNTFFLILWIFYFGVTEFDRSFMTAALGLLAALYGVSSFILFKLKDNKDYSLFFTVLTLILVAIIGANELSTLALAYFYLFMVFLIYFAFSISQTYKDIASRLIVLYLLPLVVFGTRFLDFSIFDENFFFNLTFIVVLLLNAYLLNQLQKKLENPYSVDNYKLSFIILILFSTVLAFSCYWFSTKSLLSNFQDLYIIVSLTTFTIYGLIFYFLGFFKEQGFIKYYGATVVVSVLLRLFLIDIWNMPITARIAVFFAVGFLLITTAFITTRLNKRI